MLNSQLNRSTLSRLRRLSCNGIIVHSLIAIISSLYIPTCIKNLFGQNCIYQRLKNWVKADIMTVICDYNIQRVKIWLGLAKLILPPYMMYVYKINVTLSVIVSMYNMYIYRYVMRLQMLRIQTLFVNHNLIIQ